MAKKLDGRRALITGAARGLGLACAKRLAEDGARVILADLLADELTSATNGLAEAGHTVASVVCDVTKQTDIDGAIRRCRDLWGGIDILINNAGIAKQADILTIDASTLDQVLSVNLKSAVFATQAAARDMIARKGAGVIINMSSVNAELNIPSLLAYNISKGGMNQLTRNSAIALAPHGIRVCGIGPGTILTDLTRGTVWTDESARKNILSRTPMRRAGTPEEIAAIAAFLASDDASYVTGDTIYADGGRMGLNYTVPTE